MFKSNLFNAISFNPFQRCFKKINPFGSFWRLGSQVFISPLWFPGLFLLLLLHLFTGDPSLGPVSFLGIVERPTFMPRWSGCTIWFCLGSGEDMHATFQIQQKFCRFCPKKNVFPNMSKSPQNISKHLCIFWARLSDHGTARSPYPQLCVPFWLYHCVGTRPPRGGTAFLRKFWCRHFVRHC